MGHWRIDDDTIVEALRQAGFACEKPKAQLMPGTIHFITQSLEEERAAEEASRWYDTTCPIAWGGTFRLGDGRLLRTSGTSLVWADQEQRKEKSMDDYLLNKRQEYLQRGLPHSWPDGRPCQCMECEEARRMGLRERSAAISPPNRESMMLFAAPDWKPRSEGRK